MAPTPLAICAAPMQGAAPTGTVYVEQHADGTLTVEGAWKANVRRCVPQGLLSITLADTEGYYWCFESDFIAAGFWVPS